MIAPLRPLHAGPPRLASARAASGQLLVLVEFALRISWGIQQLLLVIDDPRLGSLAKIGVGANFVEKIVEGGDVELVVLVANHVGGNITGEFVHVHLGHLGDRLAIFADQPKITLVVIVEGRDELDCVHFFFCCIPSTGGVFVELLASIGIEEKRVGFIGDIVGDLDIAFSADTDMCSSDSRESKRSQDFEMHYGKAFRQEELGNWMVKRVALVGEDTTLYIRT